MKNKQGLTIAALIVAIVGLSIGFAAFSNTLTISSSATVNPSESTLNVVWSSSSSSAATSAITPSKDPSNVTGFTATNGSITGNDYRTFSNLKASFTQPGQSVTYSTELYVYNAGQLQAQLTGITFQNATNATSGETYKHCYAATTDSNNQAIASENQATPSLVTQACNGINIKVTIGTADDVTPSTTGDKAHLNYQTIAVGSSLEASVTISYDSGSAYVDGPMEVEFGNIEINATSAVNPNLVVVPQQQGGGQEQQQLDSLVPTEQELSWEIDPTGEYYFIDVDDYLILKYDELGESGEYQYLSVNTYSPDKVYWWACNAETATLLGSMLNIDMQLATWYYSEDDGESYSVYTGPSPIDLNNFQPEQIMNAEYVTRVINSFSNNS